MQPQTYTHIVTAKELDAIKLLGFEIVANIESSEGFINTNFPNCDLFTLIKSINNILTLISTVNVHKQLHVEASIPPLIKIIYYNDDWADNIKGLALSRTFTWDDNELIVQHDFFKLASASRGLGIAKKIFQASVQQYINMDVQKIVVHAALQDGGYVWARHFFTATNAVEMKQILQNAQDKLTANQFKAIQTIYDNYYNSNPGGRDFPIQKWAELPFMETILRGSNWHGAINLKNKEQFNNFTKYVYG